MVSWGELAVLEAEFSEQVRRIFDAHIHKTMATLRRDGSPRINGTELTFVGDELWLGGKRASRKAQNLLRDGRVAIHSAPLDPEMVEGDAKLTARAVEVTDEDELARSFEVRPERAIYLRLDLEEVAVTRVAANQLEVVMWSPRAGRRTLEPA